jgi:iron-sulfur cluster repair protein YtfE (RIC family)
MNRVVNDLHRDSRRALALLGALSRGLSDGDGDGAREVMGLLSLRLRRRFTLEEEHLYPALESALGDPRFSPTARMRREHEAIRDLLTTLERDLAHDRWWAADGNLRELEAALRTHLREEEHVLHPLFENLRETARP